MRVYVLVSAGMVASACASAPTGAHGHHEHQGHKPDHHEHAFDDPETWAKRFDDPARDAWQKPAEVVRLLDLEPGMTVADLGAGTGYFLPHLQPAVGDQGRVLALDIEPKMVAYMQARATKEGLSSVEAKTIAPDDPGLADGTVDRVLIVNTWHHIGARAEYVKKLARGLKPDGSVYVVDYTPESPYGPPKEFRLTAEQVAQELGGAFPSTEIMEEELPPVRRPWLPSSPVTRRS